MPDSRGPLEVGVPGVAVWVLDAVRWEGPTPLVDTAVLRRGLAGLAPDVRVLGLVDDAAAAPRCSDLVALLDSGEWVGAAVGRSVTEAVKLVEGDLVVGAVDRASLSVVTGPEVVLRETLERVLQDAAVDGWVNVTELVGRLGPVTAVTD